MKLTIIGGARPNFMKISPIIHEIIRAQKRGNKIDYQLVHTGQHFDREMSQEFFTQLDLPEPHINLNCGGGTQAQQTAAIMVRFEEYLMKNPSDLVLVVGDVTSTMACAITSQKLGIPVAHVEGGIRSGDWKMPEEINRLVTDSITNYFFTTTSLAGENLKKSGITEEKIFFVGNTMIDTLMRQYKNLRPPDFWQRLNLHRSGYLVVTLHRPSNVDNAENLLQILSIIENNCQGIPVIFPVHPRIKDRIKDITARFINIFFADPQGYLEFNYLVKNSKAVITDSGGITEETTVMGIPCMTLRDSTERPETCSIGTNELIGTEPENLVTSLKKLFNGEWKKGGIPPLWDGKASERIVGHLLNLFPQK